MIPSKHLLTGAALGAALGLGGCGVETFLVESGSEEHAPAVTIVSGKIANTPEGISFTRPDGEAVTPVETTIGGGRYRLDLPDDTYVNGRLTATDASGTLLALVPRLVPGGRVDGVDLDLRSTAATLIVDTALALTETGLQVVDDCVLGAALDELGAAMDDDGTPAAAVLAAVEAAGGVPEDGAVAAEREAAAAEVSLRGIIDEDNIRAIFEVDFNAGRLDGNGDMINRFKWVRDEPGKQMYFVGGLHEDSPVQDSELSAMMGDTGSWTPNQVAMYDDGTHGDDVAGDNIWTISFDLPRGARIGYKYTWGQQGQLWTGTEEWPGNQRILEITDQNGDDFVRRRDNFGDEATNKDLANSNRRRLTTGVSEITWDTDLNGDDIPDARERPIDLDNDGTLDEWVTPTAIGPATVPCE
ncbi:MAG: hypothetical protein H6701_16915 [Myxococcales bacterium]|nr:hypothetical protein [Myxococcales bacterium]